MKSSSFLPSRRRNVPHLNAASQLTAFPLIICTADFFLISVHFQFLPFHLSTFISSCPAFRSQNSSPKASSFFSPFTCFAVEEASFIQRECSFHELRLDGRSDHESFHKDAFSLLREHYPPQYKMHVKVCKAITSTLCLDYSSRFSGSRTLIRIK